MSRRKASRRNARSASLAAARANAAAASLTPAQLSAFVSPQPTATRSRPSGWGSGSACPGLPSKPPPAGERGPADAEALRRLAVLGHKHAERSRPLGTGRAVRVGGAGDLKEHRAAGRRGRIEIGRNEDGPAHWCTISLTESLACSLSGMVRVHPGPRRAIASRARPLRSIMSSARPGGPGTPRLATGLCANERRSVSDRLRCPGTTGCLPADATARGQL